MGTAGQFRMNAETQRTSVKFSGDGVNEQIVSPNECRIYIYIIREIKENTNNHSERKKRKNKPICWIVLDVLPEGSCT